MRAEWDAKLSFAFALYLFCYTGFTARLDHLATRSLCPSGDCLTRRPPSSRYERRR